MGCKGKMSSECGGAKFNSKCGKYEGKLSSKSELEQCGCISVEDAFEDINSQLDDLYDELNLGEFSSECRTYSTPLSIPAILLQHEQDICEIRSELGIGECEGCSEPDPCSSGNDCCGAVVVALKYWSNDATLPIPNNQWNLMTGTDLEHTITTGTGYYKITIEHSIDFEESTGQMEVALRLNSTDPLSSLNPGFEVTQMREAYPKTIVLYQKINNGVKITPVYKRTFTGIVQFGSIKMMIEKESYQPN